MEKILTLFERADHFRVIDKVAEGCEWVSRGEGIATEKLDGTNVQVTISAGQVIKVEKRRSPSKEQKEQGMIDGWYVPTDPNDPGDKWILASVASTITSDWPDGEHSVEALGPKIQSNPLGLANHICVPFNLKPSIYEGVPRDYEFLRGFLSDLDSKFSPGHLAEGIVFHHPDGRRAKIKRKDFPRK